MTRSVFAALIMLPMLAHAQANSDASKRSTIAELAVPGAPTAAVSAALSLAPSPSPIAIQELIHARTTDDFASNQAFDPIMRSQQSAPGLKSTSTLGLLPQELANQPAVVNVVVDAMIDANGVPHNISVSHSAGTILDQKAVAAVSRYRFQPALIDNRPTTSAVSIAIKIQK